MFIKSATLRTLRTSRVTLVKKFKGFFAIGTPESVGSDEKFKVKDNTHLLAFYAKPSVITLVPACSTLLSFTSIPSSCFQQFPFCRIFINKTYPLAPRFSVLLISNSNVFKPTCKFNFHTASQEKYAYNFWTLRKLYLFISRICNLHSTVIWKFD